MPSRMLKITRMQLFFMGQVRETPSKYWLQNSRSAHCNYFSWVR
jgi:hypothetical protein